MNFRSFVANIWLVIWLAIEGVRSSVWIWKKFQCLFMTVDKFTLLCNCINIAQPRGKRSQSFILMLLNRSTHIWPLGSTRPWTTSSTTANRLIVLIILTEDNCYKQLLAYCAQKSLDHNVQRATVRTVSFIWILNNIHI